MIRAGAFKLKSLAAAAHSYYSTLTVEQFHQRHAHQCHFAPPDKIMQVFEMYCKDPFCSIAAATSLCERALGDLFVATAPAGTRIPLAFSMHDLLLTEVLRGVLGDDVVCVLCQTSTHMTIGYSFIV